MSNIQYFNLGSGGGGGSGILTINGNAPDGGGNYGLSGLNGLYVTQGVAGSSIGSLSGAFAFTTETTTSRQAVAGNAYVLTNPSLTTVDLPDNSDTSVGHTIKIIGLSGGYQISQAANQQIVIGADSSTIGISGGASCSGAIFNAITLTCVSVSGGIFIWASIDPPQGIFITT